jgi:hypothetical protein
MDLCAVESHGFQQRCPACAPPSRPVARTGELLGYLITEEAKNQHKKVPSRSINRCFVYFPTVALCMVSKQTGYARL